MKLHREGYQLIVSFLLLLLGLNFILWLAVENPIFTTTAMVLSVIFWGFIIWFFRTPRREPLSANPHEILAPADGKIVAIEETEEKEYFHDRRLQVSIFMSPLNVHQNTFPVSGEVIYTKYHPGKFLVAWHPKSSESNERNTIVIKDVEGREILVRQIAGAVARRIKTYCQPEDMVARGDEMGFIKFGSRVDLFLPLDTELAIKLNQPSKAKQTIIGVL